MVQACPKPIDVNLEALDSLVADFIATSKVGRLSKLLAGALNPACSYHLP
jgi:hypothetical protein